jgi:hypothetical protein
MMQGDLFDIHKLLASQTSDITIITTCTPSAYTFFDIIYFETKSEVFS